MLPARLALLALAVAACAWFALGAVQVHDLTRASALIPNQTTLTPAQAARILHVLDRASTLNPDRTIDVLRGETYVHVGDKAAAERVMKSVVRDEPMNVDAWIVLGIAADPSDPVIEQLAIAKQRELVPPVRRAP